MRYSAIATMLMLATLMLSISACSKQNPAEIVDNRDSVYGRGTMPKYSDNLRASQPVEIAKKYKSETHQYGAEAEVVSVSANDLPPPGASANNAQPPTQSSVQASAQQAPASDFNQPAENATINALPSRFIWPVKGQVIGQFGRQNDGNMQEGVLIEAPAGTPIAAAADGEVVYVGAQLAEYGQMVIVRHDGGYMTSYAHAQEITVSKGQRVRQGESIAKVGKSGNAPTPRLHFTVRAGKHTVDPMPYLLAAKS